VQGVGAPDSVLSAVECGVDLFDSSYAHRATAAGTALTFSLAAAEPSATSSMHGVSMDLSALLCLWCACAASACNLAAGMIAGDVVSSSHSAAIDLANERHCESTAPLLPGCTCYTCSRFAHLTEVPKHTKSLQ
jgi:queuine/archaeosine tRNA-ribosyltransferase